MVERLMTPSKVTAWLECPHYFALDGQVLAGNLDRPFSVTGLYAELLRDKGRAHEKACLAELKAVKRVREIPPADIANIEALPNCILKKSCTVLHWPCLTQFH